MKVLEITGEPIIRGGQEAFLMNCITHMDDADMQIDILTPYRCENESYRALLSQKGGNIFELHLPFEPGKSRRNLYSSVRLFLKIQSYDVVHIHSGSISALAYMAKAANKEGVKKIIVHSHSTGIRSIKHTVIQCSFSHMMNANATHYCACSIEAGLMKFPASTVKNKLIILKNGIDVSKFKFDISKRKEIRGKHGISDDELVVGHVGRFTFEKNHEFIIRMFSKLLQKRDRAKLILIGDGELKKHIEEFVRTLDLADRILFMGEVDDIQNYYNMMDVFILPSLYEGVPLSAVEAQASGLPCILSTGVTKEAALCNYVEFMDADEDKWVSVILEQSGIRCVDNAERIRKSGYSIMDTVEHLVDIYRE